MGGHSGINCAIVPLYVGEWAPSEVKGRMGSFITLGETMGVLSGYLLGLNMPTAPTDDSNQWWKVMFGIGGLFPLIRMILLLFFFRLDTPINLMKSEKHDQAEIAF
mmetsp:Transcript_8830/g.7808  ORF Transcript_8830/g.7808 Transcript_8830/m.7808 type:complete len:106 (-) Transcript_8830:692-1009(-)